MLLMSVRSDYEACIYCIDMMRKLFFSSSAGDVRFWDRRKGESFNVINVMNHGLTAFDVHPHADVLAW